MNACIKPISRPDHKLWSFSPFSSDSRICMRLCSVVDFELAAQTSEDIYRLSYLGGGSILISHPELNAYKSCCTKLACELIF